MWNMQSIKWVGLHGVDMAQKPAADGETVTVDEGKFNGTASLTITAPVDADKRTIKHIAEDYFMETHGTKPSRVVAEKHDTAGLFSGEDRWDVMVADHSSGSLVDSAEYDL